MDHTGYGYVSLEKFIDAAREVTGGRAKASDFEGKGLPTIKAVYACSLVVEDMILISRRVLTTAIIHAGRVSLDENRSVRLVEESGKWKMV